MYRLKCPRCEAKFQAEADPSEHVSCPGCGVRLRLRKRDVVSSSPGVSHSTAGSASSVGSATPRPVTKESPLAPGTLLGGFEIRRVIGRGGMALVYKGTQLSLKRPVAIKVLAQRFAKNPVFVQRFEREAGALANLNHPNIVNIIDKGVVDDHYYFVMELVEGITLDQLLHSVELNEKHYTHIIGEISKALTYVHGKGIIHRDIKPSNVLVNKAGLVKVSDFGIAHITDVANPERFGKNATVGTANYMAPEQASNPAAVDERADVYALGVTFFKMFTKQLPLDRKKGASVLNPKLPRSVDPVLAKAMSEDPAARFATVKEFCDLLIPMFVTAGKGALVGAGAGSGDTGPFMFNPEFLKPPAGPEFDSESSSSGVGSSLFRALAIPSGMDSSGTPTPFSTPAVLAKAGGHDETADPAQGSTDDSEEEKAGKLYTWIAVAIIALVILVGGGLYWYVRATAY